MLISQMHLNFEKRSMLVTSHRMNYYLVATSVVAFVDSNISTESMTQCVNTCVVRLLDRTECYRFLVWNPERHVHRSSCCSHMHTSYNQSLQNLVPQLRINILKIPFERFAFVSPSYLQSLINTVITTAIDTVIVTTVSKHQAAAPLNTRLLHPYTPGYCTLKHWATGPFNTGLLHP